jgi:hypothetical protein
MHRMHTRWALAALALACLAPVGRADYVSRTYLFDQSSVLPGGLTYGSARIEAYDGMGTAGGGLSAGQVRLTVQADALPVYGPLGDHFGVYGAGFNTDLNLDPSQISLPDGWRLRNGRFMGGFGKFAWEASGPIESSQNPLVLTISGLGTNATLDHFLIPSANSLGGVPINGSVFFAARVGDFDINNDLVDATTHVIGVGYPVPPPTTGPVTPVDPPPPNSGSGPPGPVQNPEPSALLLCALGAGSLGLGRWLRRRPS